MLTIKTYLARSPIHGMGVFAAEAVSAGRVVWEINYDIDREFSRSDYMSFPDSLRQWMARYLFITPEQRLFFCGDNARFMNHSFTPNTKDVDDYCVAAIEIQVGDELTYDYRSMQLEGDEPSFLGTR
jgi:SET domain-containing protein